MSAKSLCRSVCLSLVFFTVGCGKGVYIYPIDELGSPLEQASVVKDGSKQGEGITKIRIDSDRNHQVLVEYPPEFFPETLYVNEDSNEEIKVTLQPDQAFRETIGAGDLPVHPNEFINIDIAPRYQETGEWWRIVVAAVTGADYQPRLMDERSGYIQTQWKDRRYIVRGRRGAYIIRRRFSGNVVNAYPLRYRIKLEVQRMLPWQREFRPWDRMYKADVDLIQEIMRRTQQTGTGEGLPVNPLPPAPTYQPMQHQQPYQHIPQSPPVYQQPPRGHPMQQNAPSYPRIY